MRTMELFSVHTAVCQSGLAFGLRRAFILTNHGSVNTWSITLISPGCHVAPASIRNISPREQAKLHSLINDPRTAGDPNTRAKNVNEALADLSSISFGNFLIRASCETCRSGEPRTITHPGHCMRRCSP